MNESQSSRLHPVTGRPIDYDHLCRTCAHARGIRDYRDGMLSELRRCTKSDGLWPEGQVWISWLACDLWERRTPDVPFR